jgi:hypothetical protein
MPLRLNPGLAPGFIFIVFCAAKQTWRFAPHTSAFEGNADMTICGTDICF